MGILDLAPGAEEHLLALDDDPSPRRLPLHGICLALTAPNAGHSRRIPKSGLRIGSVRDDAQKLLESRLTEIVERLQAMRPLKILLFGSAARGESDRMSDLDVIVIAERIAPRFLDRIAEAYDLIDPRYGLDILIYSREEYEAMRAAGNSLIERAEKEGRVLFERSAA